MHDNEMLTFMCNLFCVCEVGYNLRFHIQRKIPLLPTSKHFTLFGLIEPTLLYRLIS